MRNISAGELHMLEAFANSATPGEWEVDSDGEVVSILKRHPKWPSRSKKQRISEVIPNEGGGICTARDSEYIAYASPERIKRLLEYVWHLEGMLEDQE